MNFIYKKAKLIIMISICFILLLFITSQVLSVKNLINLPTTYKVYDRDHQKLIQLDFVYTTYEEIPPIIIDYVETRENFQEIVKELFPNQLQRGIASILTPNFYTETKLLELYLNHSYFGYGIFGIGNASQYFLGKSLNELTNLDIYFLLSQIHRDGIQQESASESFLSFIKGLLDGKIITEKEFNAYSSDIDSFLSSLNHKHTYARSFVQQALEEAKKETGLSEPELFRRGYSIYTNMDQRVQQALYNKIQDDALFPESPTGQIVEAGIVILNHQTGAINGLIGGREYYKSMFNRATDSTRQPASTFKPLIVYGPAFELGWKKDDQLKDVPMQFGDFKPRNHDYDFRESIALEDALIQSLNVPTVWLLSELGFNHGFRYIEEFDLFNVKSSEGLHLALGYTEVGTSPLKMATAYTVFLNEGKMISTNAVNYIKDSLGWKVYKSKLSTNQIFTKETAKSVLDVLTKVVEIGTGKSAQLEGEWIAGKTGTTSFDGWFVGMNDTYIGAVWMGPDQVIPENRMDLTDYSTVLFKEVFSEIVKYED